MPRLMTAHEKLCHDIEHDLILAWRALMQLERLLAGNPAFVQTHISEARAKIDAVANRVGMNLAEALNETRDPML